MTDENGVNFELKKLDDETIYKLAFDIRYYKSYQGGGTQYYGSYSGAYIFRPDDIQQSSMTYASMVSIESFTAKDFVQEMHMKFENEDKT